MEITFANSLADPFPPTLVITCTKFWAIEKAAIPSIPNKLDIILKRINAETLFRPSPIKLNSLVHTRLLFVLYDLSYKVCVIKCHMRTYRQAYNAISDFDGVWKVTTS